jgi:hypothetical protein
MLTTNLRNDEVYSNIYLRDGQIDTFNFGLTLKQMQGQYLILSFARFLPRPF